MVFASTPGLVAGAIAFAASVLLLMRVRRGMRATPTVLLGVGMLLLAIALGAPAIEWSQRQLVAVMVDLSASTRGAGYREAIELDRRIKQLVGRNRSETLFFASANSATAAGNPLLDLSSTETRYAPPPAAAILLFSDGRFELPMTAPPTFVVVDPRLDEINDASVVSLHAEGDRARTEARSSAAGRSLTWSGVEPAGPTTLPTGVTLLSTNVAGDAIEVTARVNTSDAWPENDSLTIRVPRSARSERWWIGQSPAGNGWTSFTPEQLSFGPDRYLNSTIIVLHNVSAGKLSSQQHARLSQYVRNLGGTLVILGGDTSFAAGEYARTTLDDLSPLASNPPAPTTHWILLVDSSGSMASSLGETTRFQEAAYVASQFSLQLPPSDPVSIGGFARGLTWWINHEPAGKLTRPILPYDASPHGPTDLQTALETVARSADRSLPNELLIISDTDASIADSVMLQAALKQSRVRVSLLSVGETKANPALAQIALGTGGRLLAPGDAAQWPAAMREWVAGVTPDYICRGAITVTFNGTLAFLGARTVPLLNRTWLKNTATSCGYATYQSDLIRAAGQWQVGSGRVVAVAAELSSADCDVIADRLARPVDDPRMSVRWHDEATLGVQVDAIDSNDFLNGLSLTLELFDPLTGALQAAVVPQAGPGQYALERPAPTRPMLASIKLEGHIVARSAIAGHYAPEFTALGNDRAAIDRLARLTGGDVIEPSDQRPIDFHWPVRTIALAPWLAVLGAFSIGAALVRWRQGDGGPRSRPVSLNVQELARKAARI